MTDSDLTPPTPPSTAPQACIPCRRHKRKCNKVLPACELCVRLGRECDYNSPSQSAENSTGSVDVAEFERLVRKVQGLEARVSGVASNGVVGDDSNMSGNVHGDGHRPMDVQSIPNISPQPYPGPEGFPSLFFLDSQMFEYERLTVQTPSIRVPGGALASLGSSGELRTLVERYFATTHLYFPIVSKIRLYQHLSNPAHEPGADFALLFMTMKLVCSELPVGVGPQQTQAYTDVKSFFTYVEAQNGFSIQMIQVALLIALYELGHAVYPAAYLTIGHCARLGYAMGIHERGVPQMLIRPQTWTEQEERRRVWWGVIVLDRFVNLGHRGKPFASAEPSIEAHLPTDDTSWDRGQMLVAAPLSLGASQTTRASPFARVCQAAHLLGKVIGHVNDTKLPVEYRFEQALQLSKTVKALAEAMLTEAREEDALVENRLPCSAVAIAFSALLTLYDQYGCTERYIENGPETQLIMQQESIDGLREVTELALQMARRVRRYIGSENRLGEISPLTLDALYQATANYAWYVRESSDANSGERLAELKEVLTVVNERWRAAGNYFPLPCSLVYMEMVDVVPQENTCG
ncbi:hypothetical protein Q7P37_003945 [Cladosporium fusiforme]